MWAGCGASCSVCPCPENEEARPDPGEASLKLREEALGKREVEAEQLRQSAQGMEAEAAQRLRSSAALEVGGPQAAPEREQSDCASAGEGFRRPDW